MTEPGGHPLFTEALRVINRAIAANAESSPYREIVAKTTGRGGERNLRVALHEGEPDRVIDRYVVRIHEGRLESVEQGRLEPSVDWAVSVAELRRIVESPDAFVADPASLGLGWLERSLGIAREPEARPDWRIGRVRRPG